MKGVQRLLLSLSFAALLTACGQEVDTAERVEQARQYLDSGDTKAAIIELKNALQSDPKHVEARWQLGTIYFEEGDMPSADKELRTAGSLGADPKLVSPLLAQAYVFQGKTDETMALDETVLDGENLGVVLAAKGLASLSLGRDKDAAKLLANALKVAPSTPFVMTAEAFLSKARGDFDLLRSQLTKVFEVDPDYARALGLLGDLEARENNLAAAESAYSRALGGSLSGLERLDLRMKRALARIGLQKYEAAQNDTTFLLSRAPKNPLANYVQGVVHFHAEKLKPAQEAFEQAVDVKGQYPVLLFYLGTIHLMENNLEQAFTYATEFHTAAPNNVAGRKLLARLRLSRAEYEEVERLLRPVVQEQSEDVGAKNLLANALLRLGKGDEATTLLEQVAELQPDSPVARMRLGAAMLATGEQTGVEYLESALEISPEFQQGDILLVMNYLAEGEIDQALRAATAYRDRHPDTATPYNLIGRVHVAAKRLGQARQAFEQARKIAPGDAFASHSLALLALEDKDSAAAEAYYQDILEHDEANPGALLRLAALAEQGGDDAQMVAYLESALDANPGLLPARLGLARYYLREQRTDKVAVLLAEVPEVNREAPQVLRITGMNALSRRDFHAAEEAFTKWTEREPEAVEAYYLLALSYEALNKADLIEPALRKAIELGPDEITPRIALARLLLREDKPTEFARELARIQALGEDKDPRVWQLEVVRAQQQGDSKQLLSIYEKSFRKLPSTSTMIALANMKASLGQAQQALSIKRRWVEDNPEDIPARLSWANGLLQQDRTDSALVQYRKVLEQDADNLIALNNLAWFTREANPREALGHIQRAVAINGDAAAIQDTLAMVLLANGQLDEAQKAIATALSREPDNPSMRYHRVLINIASNKKATGKSELRRLLRDVADFPEKAEAQALMSKLEAL